VIVTINKSTKYATKHRIDTKLTVAKVRQECPNFFSGNRQGESVRAYKGFVITKSDFHHSNGQVSKTLCLYAYDVDKKDTFMVDEEEYPLFHSLMSQSDREKQAKEYVRNALADK
jgi:hypothetical protein